MENEDFNSLPEWAREKISGLEDAVQRLNKSIEFERETHRKLVAAMNRAGRDLLDWQNQKGS